jgi:probable HAF family extracellular repeat protein
VDRVGDRLSAAGWLLAALLPVAGCRDGTGPPLVVGGGPSLEETELSLPQGATEVYAAVSGPGGDVAGYARFGRDELGNVDYQAFVWQGGERIAIGPGAVFGISASGRLAGWTRLDGPVIWERAGSEWSTTGLPGDEASGLFRSGAAWEISPRGDRAAGYLAKMEDFRGQAVVWTETAGGAWIVEVLPSAEPESDALAVSDEGVVVGWTGPPFRAVAWTGGGAGPWTMHFLGELFGHSGSRAVGLNSAGDIVGYSDDLAGFGARRGVIWRRTGPNSWSPPREVGTPEELERRGLERTLVAAAIDERGRVVGTALTTSGIEHAFVWLPEEIVLDLTPQEAVEAAALSIDDQGRIVGATSGGTRVVLWQLR